MSLDPAVEPVDGVVLDYHSTLVHGGSPARWVADAWSAAGRAGRPESYFASSYAALLAFLDRIWEHAAILDPGSTRDLDPVAHREVFHATMAAQPGVDRPVAEALYATMLDQWTAYDDAVPTLAGLRARGVRVVLLSNVGIDLRPVLERQGLARYLDEVLMSYELGVAKPAAAAFQAALDALGVPASRALMVGDNPVDDAGAAACGIRTLLLPRTAGTTHGLGVVLRLV